MNQEKLFNQIKYVPHSEAQWSFHNSDVRFQVACCGRRFGKTTMSGRKLTSCMMDLDLAGNWYWIVGPDYSLGEKEFRVVHTDLQKLGILGKCKVSYAVNQGNMSIKMPWGTHLEVKSAAKKEGLLGEGLSGAVMSEAARHATDTWEQYIRPALSDKLGWAVFPSTPKGFNNYYGITMRGYDPSFPDWVSYKFPSWENLVAFPGGRQDPEILEVERTTSEQFFQQEYGAEFTTFVGKIYTEFNPQVHIRDVPYHPEWDNYWAIDFGFSAPFVCLDVMVDPMENVYVWREYLVRGLTAYEHAIRLKDLRENPAGFHVNGVMVDPRGAGDAATLELTLGPVFKRAVPWEQGIECVKRWLKIQPDGLPKLFISPQCPELIRQMQILRMADPSRNAERNPSEKQHDYDDHAPDALRYFFNEMFVLGANMHLSELYPPNKNTSDFETYFQYDHQFVQEVGSRF